MSEDFPSSEMNGKTMVQKLPSWILAPLTVVLLALNLGFWGVVFLLLVPFRWIVPPGQARIRVIGMLERIVERWAGGNRILFDATQSVSYEIRLQAELSRTGRYLILCNHRSWLDIPVLMRVLLPRISFIRFFLKRELIWLPIVGAAAWALEFPFMRRYPREVLERRPDLRRKDLETTRRVCERFGEKPESLLNFMEGTRFTEERHRQQSSPYRHLLRPKSGGVAFVLGAAGQRLDAILDVTIVYPPGDSIFLRFVSGRIPWVAVDVRSHEVPPEFTTEAIWDEGEVRERFRTWIRELWNEKDQTFEALLGRMKMNDSCRGSHA